VGRGGRLLLRPAAAPRRQRHAAQGALDGRAPSPVRDDVIEAWQRSASRGRWPRSRNACAGCPSPEDHPPHGPRTLWRERTGGIVALVNPERLRRILTKMLDENEFLSPYGIRSLSRFHERHPYVFHVNGQEYRVDYLPGRSRTPACSAATPTGGAGLDAGERAHPPGAAELLPVLRRQLQDRVPHGSGKI